MITKNKKERKRKGKVLIINAVKEVRQDKNIAFLEEEHISKIHKAYKKYEDIEGFCKVVDIKDILSKNASLNMPLYVSNVVQNKVKVDFDDTLQQWQQSSEQLKASIESLFEILK